MSRKIIGELFGGGGSHAVAAFPVKAVWLELPAAPGAGPAAQVLFSVPKRRMKHAVDRNRVKRQLREAYRHHKQRLAGCAPEGERLAIAFIWLSDSHLPSAEVDKRVDSLLLRIARKTAANQPVNP